MSKMLEATCSSSGIVSAEGVQVPAAQVLSKGSKASSGILLLQGVKVYYLTSNATDIEELITKLVSIIDVASTIFSAHDGALGNSQAAALAQLESLKTELNQSKETLK